MWQLPGAIAAEHSSALAAAKFRVLFCFYEPNFVRRNEPLMQVGEGQLAPGNPVAVGEKGGALPWYPPAPFSDSSPHPATTGLARSQTLYSRGRETAQPKCSSSNPFS